MERSKLIAAPNASLFRSRVRNDLDAIARIGYVVAEFPMPEAFCVMFSQAMIWGSLAVNFAAQIAGLHDQISGRQRALSSYPRRGLALTSRRQKSINRHGIHRPLPAVIEGVQITCGNRCHWPI
ncbi:MAG TPA: hypothetical protein VGN42_27830 [Pirellulales bacterium]|jgi:hypothetical protein|nr:hypothetical protein [Pirellulales bacterium]